MYCDERRLTVSKETMIICLYLPYIYINTHTQTHTHISILLTWPTERIHACDVSHIFHFQFQFVIVRHTLTTFQLTMLSSSIYSHISHWAVVVLINTLDVIANVLLAMFLYELNIFVCLHIHTNIRIAQSIYTHTQQARAVFVVYFYDISLFFGMFIYKIYSGLFSVTTHTHTIDEKNNHEFKNAMVFVCILCSDNEWICKFIRFILYRLQAPFGCYVIWSSKHQQHHLIGNVFCGIHVFYFIACVWVITYNYHQCIEQHERIERFLWLLLLLFGFFSSIWKTTQLLWDFHTFLCNFDEITRNDSGFGR